MLGSAVLVEGFDARYEGLDWGAFFLYFFFFSLRVCCVVCYSYFHDLRSRKNGELEGVFAARRAVRILF